MSDFFRKEREDVFASRFAMDPSGKAWTIKPPGVIFQAKNFQEKTFNAIVNGQGVAVRCKVDGSRRGLTFTYQAGPALKTETLTETAIAALMLSRSNLYLYEAVCYLFKKHASASTNSPLISGCVASNFQASTAYPGRKLRLVLKNRAPIPNPFSSGVEKEHFLIGEVTASDCQQVWYLGHAAENLKELVSLIPRLVA
ncbi:MAG: hypothetical protein R2729_31875 [Bryobacteraceae bacterium]